MQTSGGAYRGPLVAGGLLLVAGLLIVVADGRERLAHEVGGARRHADSLSAALLVIAEDVAFDDVDQRDRFAHLLRRRLQLFAPLRFAGVVCGDTAAAAVGDPTLVTQHDQAHPVFVVRESFRRPPPPPPRGPPGLGGHPDRPPHPWVFLPPGPDAVVAACDVVVVVDAQAPPFERRQIFIAGLTKLALAWLAIVFLVFAWIRTIRARILSAALDAERRENDRLAELGLAASGLAHETKNPLGIIHGLAQRLARSDLAGDQRPALAEAIIDEVDRASARLSEFIDFAKPAPLTLSNVDVAGVVADVVQSLGVDLEEGGVRVDVDVVLPPVTADAAKLEQILVNLVLNSVAACADGGLIRVVGRAAGDAWHLSVTDDGCGIPPDLIDDVMKPYVTGRSNGHGLGLAIVQRLVTQHGWRVSVQSVANEGTSVTITNAPAERGAAP